MKKRILRAVRANLNHLLDQVREFEDEGGFGQFINQAQSPFTSTSGETTTGAGNQPHTPPPAGVQPKTIREYYANLEVPFGSDLQTVKAAYHRLMRQYHPDRHANDPEMEAIATELSQELARAYQAVESYLKTGRY